MAKKNAKVWDPEFKYQSVSGQFVDYAGNTRDYTMVAVSVPTSMVLANWTGYRMCEKVLTIGIAVRSVQDNDNGMGVRIAYGKALKKADHVLAVTHEGMINTTMVDALLAQEASYFEKNPGMYLAGYNDDKERWYKTGRVANAEKNGVCTDTLSVDNTNDAPSLVKAMKVDVINPSARVSNKKVGNIHHTISKRELPDYDERELL